MIKELFPTAIYQTNIPCPDKEWEGMMDLCDEFWERNQEEINGHGNMTGDQDDQKFFMAHRSEKFYWLNYQVSKSMQEYLRGICRDTDDGKKFEYAVFVQKAWTSVVSPHSGRVPEHLHKGSHFSAIYYLRTEGEGGVLTLCASSGFEMSPINVHERYLNYDVEVEDGDLVIFPANMMHFVSEFEGDEHRAAIVYDLFITLCEEVDEEYENVVTLPSYWARI